MNHLNSLSEYEEFIYGLPQEFPAIVYSTLLVVRRGAGTALVRGEVIFSGGVRLLMSERLMLLPEYYGSSATVTRSGAARRSFTGTIRNPIPATPPSAVHTRTTNTSHPTSDTIVYQLQA